MFPFSNPQNLHQEFSSEGKHSAASIAIGSSTVLPDHLHVSKGEVAVSANEVTTSQRSITGFAGAEIAPEFEAKLERLPSDVRISGAHPTRRTTDFLFVLMDFLLLWLAASVSLMLSSLPLRTALGLRADKNPHIEVHIALFLLYSGFVVLFCNAHRLYRHLQVGNAWHEAWATIKAVGMASILLTTLIFALQIPEISRVAVVVTAVLSACFLVSWRQVRRRRIANRVAAGRDCRNVLIVGTGLVGARLKHHLDENRQFGYLVKGFLECPSSNSQHVRNPKTESHILGSVDQLARIARMHFIDELLIAIPHNRELVKDVAFQARKCGLAARVIPDLYDGLALGAPVEYLGLFPTMSLHHEPARDVELLLKRFLDVIVSIGALVAVAPLMFLAAGAIYLDDRGPIFYRSKRVGKKGKIFDCLKLRTMVVNADDMVASLRHLNEREGLLFKITNDPRITRVGRILRRYSIDEIPQFWNVLKGEMSLVGPRPPLASEFEQYDLEYFRRLDAMPGITGMWQVEARQSASFEAYINLDLYYVEHWSLLLDLKLLLKTIAVVFAGTGH